MKKSLYFVAVIVVVLLTGCNMIGNGVAKTHVINVFDSSSIEIEGDWQVEIICGSEEDVCEITLDENLSNRFKFSNSDELEISLSKNIFPMTPPRLRLKLKKPFLKLALEDKNICNVRNLKNVGKMEIELADNAILTLADGKVDDLTVELEDRAKFTCSSAGKLRGELDDRAVLDAGSVDELYLECSGRSVARIKKSVNAFVQAYDMSSVRFGAVKNIQQYVSGEAEIDFPVEIPEHLKKDKR